MTDQDVRQARRLRTATAFTFVFMGGYAVAFTMLGTLLPQIIHHYDLSLTLSSSIAISNDVGMTLSMLVGLFVVDRMDKGKMLPLTAICFGLALLLHSIAPPFAVLLLARVGVGLTGGLVDNLCATYISDLYGDRRARYVSIVHTLYAVGSTVAPKFAALCFTMGGWTLSYLVIGCIALASGLAALLVFRVIGYPKTAVAPSTGVKEKVHIPYKEMLTNRNMRWLCVASFLFAGQTYVTLWLSTYLNWLDSSVYTIDLCSTILTAASIGMIISRVMLAAISEKVGTVVYLRWASLSTAAILVAMLLIQQPTVWLVGSFFYGVASGAMYTARFVLSCQEFPQFSSTASALTGVFSTLGSMVFSTTVGRAADAGYYTQAMLAIAGVILLAFFIFAFFYRPKKA